MSLTVLTAATSRLLTTKDALGLQLGDAVVLAQVDLFDQLIAHASAAVERECGLVLAQQRYREILLRQRDPMLLLKRRPIVEVDSVTLDGTAYTDYRIEQPGAGILYRRDGWWGLGWLAEWTVTYVAGFILPSQVAATAPEPTGERLPADIEQAVIETIKVWQHELVPSERVAAKTFGLTGDRIDYRLSATRESLPPLARHLVAPWRSAVLA